MKPAAALAALLLAGCYLTEGAVTGMQPGAMVLHPETTVAPALGTTPLIEDGGIDADVTINTDMEGAATVLANLLEMVVVPLLNTHLDYMQARADARADQLLYGLAAFGALLLCVLVLGLRWLSADDRKRGEK